MFWAGRVQGLIHGIPTCQELLDRIITDVEQSISQRGAGFMGVT